MRKAVCCFVSFFVVMTMVVTMEAQELTTEKIFFDMPLVVTAARYEQSMEEASSVISVITAKDIARSGAQTLADVLRLAAGIDVRTRYGNVETQKHVDIRGLGGSSEAHRVLLLFNGIPMNWITHGNFKADESIALNMIKRIEIIRGPGSAMYGANAFNGVINIIMKDKDDVKNAELIVYGGNDKTKKVEGIVATHGNWGDVLISGRHYDTLGARVVTDHDAKKVDNVYMRVTSYGWDLTGGLGNSNIESPGWLANKSLENFTNKEDRFLAAKYNYKLNEKMDVIPQIYIRKNNNSIMLNKNYMFLDEHSLGGSVQYNYVVSDRNTLIAGFEYKNDEAFYPGQWVGKKREYTYAGFVQEEYRPITPLSVTLGARYDKNSLYSAVVSPRVAAAYKLRRNIIIKSDYGSAYRAPTFYELYTVIPVGTCWLDGNSELRPEKTNSLNVEVLHQVSGVWQYRLAGFRNRIRDMIAYEGRGTRPFYGRPIPVAFRMNKDKVEVKGAEAEIKAKIRSVESYINYSYQVPKNVVTGDNLINAPEHKVNAGLSTMVGEYVATHLTAHYVDLRKSETAVESGLYVTVPKYVTTDLKVSVLQLYPGLELSFLVYNLFNEAYEETYQEPGPGRRYYGEMNFSF